MNLLGVLAAGEAGEGLPADRATLLFFGQLMHDLFYGKSGAALAAIALRTRLFATVLLLFTLRSGLRVDGGFLVGSLVS